MVIEGMVVDTDGLMVVSSPVTDILIDNLVADNLVVGNNTVVYRLMVKFDCLMKVVGRFVVNVLVVKDWLMTC